MNNYEAMFIIKPDLNDEERQAVTQAIKDQIAKNEGQVVSDEVWAQRRKLAFDIFPIGGGTRFREGFYFLVRFTCSPAAVEGLRKVYGLNENILRSMILRTEAAAPAA